jgi:hypothetical protein
MALLNQWLALLKLDVLIRGVLPAPWKGLEVPKPISGA